MQIKERRQSMGYSQIKLAQLAQVSLPTIQNIEAGKANPTLDIIEKIGHVLGYSVQIQVAPIQWSVLIQAGLPLFADTSTASDKNASLMSLTPLSVQTELRKAFLALTNKTSQLSLRQTEATLSLALAIFQHYPTVYKKYSTILPEKKLMLLLHKNNIGRLIKLRRLSLANLKQEYF